MIAVQSLREVATKEQRFVWGMIPSNSRVAKTRLLTFKDASGTFRPESITTFFDTVQEMCNTIIQQEKTVMKNKYTPAKFVMVVVDCIYDTI